MFPRPDSTTNDLSLDEFCSILQSNPEVAAIVLAGSTATGLNPASDLDLAIIVDTHPCPASTGTTWVEGRLADLGFASRKQVAESLAGSAAERKDDWLEIMAVGKIVYDRDGLFRKGSGERRAARTPRSQLFHLWDHASYNLEQSRRYVNSDDAVYHDAFRLRMNYQLSDMMLAYFSLRHIAWRGEKAAIRYWQENDPGFRQLFLDCQAEQDLRRQLELYEEVVRRAVEPVGLPWRKAMISVTPAEGFEQDEALRFYLTLVGA